MRPTGATTRFASFDFAWGKQMSRAARLANELSKRAGNLDYFARIMLAITLLGALIAIVIGVIPTCPPLTDGCYESEKTQASNLVLIGASVALISCWFYFVSSVIAARAQLAAEVATPVTETDP
jgi:hypothetical protein